MKQVIVTHAQRTYNNNNIREEIYLIIFFNEYTMADRQILNTALETQNKHMDSIAVNSKLKIGLALGSGSSRGWAHIGVIKALTA